MGLTLGEILVRLRADVSRFDPDIGQAVGSLGRLNAAARAAAEGINVGALAAGVAGLAAVKMASDFESAFAKVRKTVDTSTTDIGKLRGSLIELSKTIPVTATEMATIAAMGGQMGITGERNLKKFTETVARLAVTSDMSSTSVAEMLARIAQANNIPISQIDRLGSSLVYVADKSNASANEVLRATMMMQGLGASAGLTAPQMFGLSAALVSTGLRIESMGNATGRMARDIAVAVARGGEKLTEMAKLAGMTAEEFRKLYKENAAEGLVAIIAGLAREGDKAFGSLEKLGWQNLRVSGTALNAARSVDAVRKALKDADDGYRENTSLTEKSNIIFDTFASKMQLVKNGFTALGIEIGTSLLPTLKLLADVLVIVLRVVGDLVGVFNQIPESIRGPLVSVGALALIFKVFGASLPAFIASMGGGLVSAFTAGSAAITGTTSVMANLGVGMATAGPAIAATGLATYALTRYLMDNTEWGVKATTAIGNYINKMKGIDTKEISFAGVRKDGFEGNSEQEYQAWIRARIAQGNKKASEVAGKGTSSGEDDPTKAQNADFNRKRIELEREYQTALASTKVGLDAEIDRIKAHSEAQKDALDIDDKLTAARRNSLKAIIDRTTGLEIANAKERETQKIAAEQYRIQEKYSTDMLGWKRKTAEASAMEEAGIDGVVGKIRAEAAASEMAVRANKDYTGENKKLGDQMITQIELWAQTAEKTARARNERELLARSTALVSESEKGYLAAMERLHPSMDNEIAKINASTNAKVKEVIQLLINKKIKADAAKEAIDNYNKERDVLEALIAKQKQIQQYRDLAGLFGEITNVLTAMGFAADSAFVSIASGLEKGANAAQQFLQAQNATQRAVAVLGAVGGIINTGKEKGAGAGMLSGAATGAVMGSVIPGVGTALGAAIGGVIGLAAGLFGKGAYKKVMEEVGKTWGVSISDGLAKTIAATADKLHINFNDAALLNLPKIIDESGEKTTAFKQKIVDLLDSAKSGTKEWMQAVNDTFRMAQDEASQLGQSYNATTTLMIATFRAQGRQLTGEMQALVDQMLDKAVKGLQKLHESYKIVNQIKRGDDGAPKVDANGNFKTENVAVAAGGLTIATEKSALAQATIFSSVFWATVQEKGLIFAADALGSPLQKFIEGLQGSGLMSDAVKAILDPILASTALAGNEMFRGAAEGAVNLAGILEGLAASAYLTKDAFAAFGVAGMDAYNQAIAAGATEQQAILAIMPLLTQLRQAHDSYGYQLTEEQQKLMDLAEKNGLAFPTDPIIQVRDAIYELIEAITGIPRDVYITTHHKDQKDGEPTPTQQGPPNGTASGNTGYNGGNNGGANYNKSPDYYAALGFYSDDLPKDTLIQAHRGERVSITPAGGSVGSQPDVDSMLGKMASDSRQQQPIVIENKIHLDGNEVGKWITQASKTGQVRVHETAVRKF